VRRSKFGTVAAALEDEMMDAETINPEPVADLTEQIDCINLGQI
jgi:hypothetical protein